MIKLGALLGHLKQKQQGANERDEDVNSLKQALETKLLMDQLKPQDDSFSHKFTPSRVHNLGEDHITPSRFPSFKSILDSASSSLIGVTKYLLERKKAGNPLSAKEDSELQKFYYNRASGILKKIVLLKDGGVPEKSPAVVPSDDHDDRKQKKRDAEKRANEEIEKARDHADAVVDKLNFDSKLAIANAKYNKEMVVIRERRAKAAVEERKQAEAQELKTAEKKLVYDQKVADAQQNYNQVLGTELMQRKEAAEASVRKASEAKHRADMAAVAASNAAREADAEAKEAEDEAEAATKRAKLLEKKETTREAQLAQKHHLRGHSHAKLSKKEQKPVQIPLTLVPKAHLAGMLRYLESALNHHQTISPAEQQLMQSFFLTKGSTLLSELAQVNPDATWHSGGVMAEQQYEMDRGHPDQLSREWGSKHLKGDRVVTDFVHDAIWARKDSTKMARPDGNNAVQGFLGMKAKVPLQFAPDNSPPQLTEPDLGESQSAHDVREHQHGAFSAMMGIN